MCVCGIGVVRRVRGFYLWYDCADVLTVLRLDSCVRFLPKSVAGQVVDVKKEKKKDKRGKEYKKEKKDKEGRSREKEGSTIDDRVSSGKEREREKDRDSNGKGDRERSDVDREKAKDRALSKEKERDGSGKQKENGSAGKKLSSSSSARPSQSPPTVRWLPIGVRSSAMSKTFPKLSPAFQFQSVYDRTKNDLTLSLSSSRFHRSSNRRGKS